MEYISLALDLIPKGIDKLLDRTAPFADRDFVEAYSDQLREAIDLVPDVWKLNEGELRAGVKALLGGLVSAVESYHRDPDGFRVNANYMIPVPSTAELVAAAKFTRRDRAPEAFSCFLKLIAWAEDTGDLPTEVLLPVEADAQNDPVLFGAPRAFATGQLQLFNASGLWKETTNGSLHGSVRDELSRFFQSQEQRMASFASFPVRPPAGRSHCCQYPVMAVLNIDANRPNIFGRLRKNQTQLRLVLEPIAHVLSYFLMQLHFAGQGN